MRVIHADDHQMFQDGLVAFVESTQPDWQLVCVGSIDALLEELRKGEPVDCIVLDLHMPGKTVEDLFSIMENESQHVPVIMLSMDSDLPTVRRCMAMGVHGFVSKESRSQELICAVQAGVRGELYFDQIVLRRIAHSMLEQEVASSPPANVMPEALSLREREVFQLLVQNHTIEAISDQLCISKKTVENHRTAIYQKLEVRDRFELFQYASRAPG